MKTVKILSIVFAAMILTYCSGEKMQTESGDVPTVVMKSFNTVSKDAKDVKWQYDGKTYIAEYEKNGYEVELIFDENGNVIEKEFEFDPATLPQNIIQYVQTNYQNTDIEEAAKVFKGENLFFEVGIEINDSEIDLIFDENGNFLMLEQEDEDGDENGEVEDDDDADDENEVEITTADIPQLVMTSLNADYPNCVVVEADKVFQADGSITYDIEIEHNSTIIEVMYNSQGNFLGVEND